MEKTKSIQQLKEVERYLRLKCKRYRKHVKGLQRGIEWRNTLILELMQRLGDFDEGVVLSGNDFKKLLDNIGEVVV